MYKNGLRFSTMSDSVARKSRLQSSHTAITGFIRVREMSGKFNFFQGQGIVREFYVVSGKNE